MNWATLVDYTRLFFSISDATVMFTVQKCEREVPGSVVHVAQEG